MSEKLFSSEESMQQWLSDKIKETNSLSDFVIGIDDFKEKSVTDLIETKIYKSFLHCLHSFDILEIISEMKTSH